MVCSLAWRGDPCSFKHPIWPNSNIRAVGWFDHCDSFLCQKSSWQCGYGVSCWWRARPTTMQILRLPLKMYSHIAKCYVLLSISCPQQNFVQGDYVYVRLCKWVWLCNTMGFEVMYIRFEYPCKVVLCDIYEKKFRKCNILRSSFL